MLSVIYYRTITSDAGHLQVLGPLSTLLDPERSTKIHLTTTNIDRLANIRYGECFRASKTNRRRTGWGLVY